MADIATVTPASDNSTISLRELLATLRRSKLFIGGFTAICVSLAAVLAYITPDYYKASVLLSVSKNSTEVGSLGSLASQFGGLASLAGISVQGDSSKWESIAVLQSAALTQEFISKNQLLPVLFADRWDAQKKAWKSDPSKPVPTLWKGNEFFLKKVRKINTDNRTGLTTLSIVWRDPKLAAAWANQLVKIANDYLRQKAIQESERNIGYLNEEALKTSNVEARQAIYSVLRTEINKAMLARASDEYAFKIIDPATVPEKPDSPQRLLWILTGLFGGFLVALFATILRISLR